MRCQVSLQRLDYHPDSQYVTENTVIRRILDHIQTKAPRDHNGYLAERDYGKEMIERHRCSASRVSEPVAAHTIGWCPPLTLLELLFSLRWGGPV